jgi:chromosome segregation ATPase
MSSALVKEDGSPTWLGSAVLVVLGVALTFFMTSYFNQNQDLHNRDQSVETRLQNHDLAIATLNISVANIVEAQHRTEASVAAIEQTQTQMMGKLQSLQDANDAQAAVSQNIKDQFLDLRKQITDNNNEMRNALNSIFGDMRNSRSPPGR